MDKVRNDFKQQLEKCESDRLKCINELEKELVKQRERTMKLLAEKEDELDKFRKENGLFSKNENNSELDTINGLDQSGLESSLLYVTQSNAYKETELNKLRLAKNDLEYKLKQTYDEHSVDIDRLQTQISLLKNEIERLKLNQTRSELNSQNLEYIKNVVFSYLTTKDLNVKLSMVNAIMQILQFTKNEKQKINQILKFSV